LPRSLQLAPQLEAQLQKEQQSVTTATDKEDQEELKARIAQLRQLEKDLDDPGPLYDCLVSCHEILR
jgi:hypothetical protein